MAYPTLRRSAREIMITITLLATAVVVFATSTTPAAIKTSGADVTAVAEHGFADLIDGVQTSVVTIKVQKPMVSQLSTFPNKPGSEPFFQRFFGPGAASKPQIQGAGSGFFIDAEGYIVTNGHVVADADTIIVQLHDGREFSANIIGRDDKTDLAVLKIDAEVHSYSTFGDSDATRVGDWVIAIGNPFGLGGSATLGIVSARGRDIHAGPYDDYLQIDAPINRGNSGGPVFNAAGEVIGVSTAIYSPNGGSVGIGFAIPANQVIDVVAELKERGTVERGWLGVQLQDLDESLARELHFDDHHGALVTEVVADSPAARVGIVVGDVIVSFAGSEVAHSRALSRLVGQSDPGDKVRMTVRRAASKDSQTFSVTLGVGPGQSRQANNAQAAPALGLHLTPLSDSLRARLDVAANVSGLLVEKLSPQSTAAKQGLRPGDILLQADGRTLDSPQEFHRTIEKAQRDGRKTVLVLVKRGPLQQFRTLAIV